MPDRLPASQVLISQFTRAFAGYAEAVAVIIAEDRLEDGQLVFANAAFTRALSGDRGRPIGRSYRSLTAPSLELATRPSGTLVGRTVIGGKTTALLAVPLYDHRGILRFRAIFHNLKAAEGAEAAGAEGGYAALLNGAASGVIVHREFRPLYANRMAARLLGFDSPEDLMAEPSLLRFLPVDRLEKFLKRHGRGEGGKGRQEHYTARCLDAAGRGTWLEINGSQTEWAGGRATVLNFLDAGDKIRARRNEALLREAIDNLADSFILYDSNDRVVLTNRSFHEAFPFLPPQHEIVGSPMIDLVRSSVANDAIMDSAFDPENAEAWIANFIAKRRNTKASVEEDSWPSGRWDLVKEHRLESGGFVSVRTNITARKQAEFALKRQEHELEAALELRTKHLQAVLSNIAQGVVVLDKDLRVVLTNSGVHELVGYSLALGRPGTHVSELIRDRLSHGFFLPGEEESGLDLEELVERRLESYRTLTRQRYRHIFPKNRLVEIVRERLPDGMIVCTFTDVTDQERAERELARQREALYQSEKLSALGMLLAGVAHELNNPLQVVLGQATLLEGLCQDATRRERAGRIRGAAERCAKIVKTFLAMARDQPASRVPVAVNELIEGALDLIHYQLRRSDVEVQRSLANDLPAVLGDRDQLNQVLVNLLINAMQAMEEVQGPRRITLATAAPPGSREIEITVTDCGPGVPKELRGRIFDPFFTTKPVGAGTGVGLAVCHGMISAHGGSILVDEAEGGGARFRIYLPCIAEGAADGGRQDEPQEETAKGRILIVDDEPEICQLLRDFLEEPGVTVDLAESGDAALLRLTARDYDAIVCDLRMPGLDGRRLYGKVAARKPKLLPSFIFATGDLLSSQSQTFLRESGCPCLEKPFRPEQVRRVVGQVLEQSAAGRRR